MSLGQAYYRRYDPRTKPRTRRTGFTLIELLTVMFIISLLIGLLIPAMNRARDAAKKSATVSLFHALDVGLSTFKNDHESSFPRTHGYPPSFAHPPIPGVDFKPHEGEFPFLEEKPVVTGAHWLPAMLIGVDRLGYVKRQSIPKKGDIRKEPWKWYEPDPLGPGTFLDRMPFYIDPGGTKTLRTDRIPGVRNSEIFKEDWEEIKHLPVIVDSWDQPVLYYAAQANGRTSNIVGDERDEKNEYEGGPQKTGPPTYFHQDNLPFTGRSAEDDGIGWDFGEGAHAIAESGADLSATNIVLEENRETFARFLVDRKQYQSLLLAEEPIPPTAPLKVVNPDTYLLISAGVDGRFGTNDDITNFSLDVE
ncbi:MAG: prepilin-type N-terminal cleavage/methylation domain-containing protein [Phycisphaerales bacterium]|nr:MAG: prepilin-type N-terminal cleavage/methylation domain-containing protein [Phycisphaerales bacterium]